MTIKMIVIPADYSQPRLIECQPGETLATLQREIGGYIDCVRLSDDADLWVHDEGLLIALPLNRAATMISARPLVGPAVLTGGADAEGETRGLDNFTAAQWMVAIGAMQHALQQRLAPTAV